MNGYHHHYHHLPPSPVAHCPQHQYQPRQCGRVINTTHHGADHPITCHPSPVARARCPFPVAHTNMYLPICGTSWLLSVGAMTAQRFRSYILLSISTSTRPWASYTRLVPHSVVVYVPRT